MENPKWFDSALIDLGQKEITGPASNLRIVEYHKTTGGPAPDEIAWCSSFVNFHIVQAGMLGTGSRLARSWLSWGRALSYPIPGCIVVLERGSEPWMGHVGFYVKDTDKSVAVLGGNQGDAVTIDHFSKTRVIEYRWPTALEGYDENHRTDCPA